MLIRKYRAKYLKEALKRVKADLGDEATVLSSRTIKVGLLSKQIEVTATMASMSGGVLSPRPAPAPAPAAGPGGVPSPTLPGRGYAPPPPLRRPPVRTGKAKVKARANPMIKARPDPGMQRVLSPLRKEIRALSSEIKTLANDSENSSRIVDSLDELRLLLGALKDAPMAGQRRHATRDEQQERNSVLGLLAEQLVDSGMRPSLVRDVVRRVEDVMPQDAEDASTCLENLAAQVMAADMSSVPAVERHEGPCRAVAVVGPTGVGKTCTLIKIATRASLVHGLRVAVVAGDTQGIGAIKALSETARIIGLPCRLAETADDLAAAVRELGQHSDLVLVDTCGCTGRDEAGVQQLQAFLGQTPVEPILLLNADMRCLEIDANLRGFSRLEPAALIFTKLDQAMELGGLYDAATSSSLPVMYLTNGRRIPEDIEEATPEKVASQIMGFSYN